MKNKRLLIFLSFVFSLLTMYSCENANEKVETNRVNWDKFLLQHDLLWDSIPPNYYAGAILGNGLIGTNIYATEDGKSYKWTIGRVDVNENREGADILFDKARLPIGYFTLTPSVTITEEQMRLSLWDAEVVGKLSGAEGAIDFKTIVHAHENVIEVNLSSSNQSISWKWDWHPDEAISPRVANRPSYIELPSEYASNPNPPVQLKEEGGINFSIQKLYSGNVYVAAWVVDRQSENVQKVLVTVSQQATEERAVNEAKATLEDYRYRNNMQETHRNWWHDYYMQSYINFPDAQVESFYWIQQYKLACLTREDKYVIDLQGPWTYFTPWPATWWNLNVQLTYSPLFTANRLELSEPLWRSLNDNIENLQNNVPEPELKGKAIAIGRSSSLNLVSPLRKKLAQENQYEVGNMTWVLFYYYQYCMYKGDSDELINRFYPLLKKSIAYYEFILKEGADGKLHLPLTASPEYKAAEDCNYDLALLRWGLHTLLEVNEECQLGDDSESKWTSILDKLVDYPVDENGYLIGKDVKLEYSHRHYSHMLMIYPLQLVSWDNENEREVITQSMNHWLGMKGALQGYTFTGAASMYALQGNGDKAIDNLRMLLTRYIQPNTLYRETGPVIETPLSAATSLQELYLQSSKNDIRVFPAVPTKWENVTFVDLRAYGGILVSATHVDGKTRWIQLEATSDMPYRFFLKADMRDNLNVNSPKASVSKMENGIWSIEMKKGDIIQIIEKGYEKMPIHSTSHVNDSMNTYGMRKR